ncbi:hypothetical protein ACS0TY_016259 [Phlomoides rotata]
MEGLIPYVYKAITQYRHGATSPSASYTRLPGDSGRFDFSPPEFGVSPCSTPPSAAKRDASAVLQPPTKHHFTNSCRAIK